ncbi:hypothetical protein FGG08_006845 [Glutinoglossum americanum]|uniref:Uncharacterized protein n=1 Tax=Glutinoglossum americanum TaxID=1670608 RepID=A0A9P8I4G9_9PEZI|nr:hypothetical protein FGG08_006845 [Glutinoglossum americanum]
MVIDSVFDYLDREDMKKSIDVEFAIYRHHHRNLSGRSRLSWLRNMFYSLIQQLVRQDPVWYAIIASARPDKNWRLITYPYITKDTDAGGETTGFLHLDLNTSKFVQNNSGGNLLSSSMSLDDEESDGCTVVILSFHHHIKEWHARRLGCGKDLAGFTTNCSTSYRTEDRRDWGEPEPASYPAFGSIVMESSLALEDALVSRRKWTDSQVCKERDILLGDNDKRVRAYVTVRREKLIMKYKEHGLETNSEDIERMLTIDNKEENMSISDDNDNKRIEEKENSNDDIKMKN